jgi:hypothetical protein
MVGLEGVYAYINELDAIVSRCAGGIWMCTMDALCTVVDYMIYGIQVSQVHNRIQG